MRIALTGGAYTARSVVASAQRCVNLYAEAGPSGAIIDLRSGPEGSAQPGGTKGGLSGFYPTAGLNLLTTLPQMPVRGLHQASNGTLYAVGGSSVYAMTQTPSTAGVVWSYTLIGTITPGIVTPVSMSDNGLQMVIVDGSAAGWQVTLATNAFSQIVDPTGAFRGGDRVDYLDTFFLFNVPGTPQFQTSLALSTTFDSLYFANKESYSDLLVTLVVTQRQIWLIGQLTTEVWYNTGAADFPFQSTAGVFVDKGCIAKYSAVQIDNGVYWLAQDRYGDCTVIKGFGYQYERVSTFAIENAFAGYVTLTDAIGMTYEIGGHLFYVLAFPSADKTWAYDITTGLWHEWVWIDSNGTEHRHRANCIAYSNGNVIVGDWQSGALYQLSLAAFTDAGNPIVRRRGFAHLIADGSRVFHRQLIADMESGQPGGDVTILAAAVAFDREDSGQYLREDSGDLMREQGSAGTSSGMISLRWSDDGGHRFSNPIRQSLGRTGDYLTSVQYQRLGTGRDRTYEVFWSLPVRTILQGVWLVVQPAAS